MCLHGSACLKRDRVHVRHIGMSGTLPNLTDHIAMGVFEVFQIPTLGGRARARGAHRGGRQGIVIRGGAAKGAPTEGKQDGGG